MNKKSLTLAALLVTIALLTGRVYYVRLTRVCTGEELSSPNSKYSASAMDCYSETFLGKSERHFEFRVKIIADEKQVFFLHSSPIDGPYFGSRSSHKVVFWNKNSSQVEFRFPQTTITAIVN